MLRVIGLLLRLVVFVVSGGALAWWIATSVMRLRARWLERSDWFREGEMPKTALHLFVVAAFVSAAIDVVAYQLYFVLISAPEWVNITLGWAVISWYVLSAVAMMVVSAAGTVAAFREASSALALARQRRYLLDRSKDVGCVVEKRPDGDGRRIVIFCDGTGNRPDQMEDGEAAATNVWRLYRSLRSDETQVTWYQPGIGSDTSSTAAEARRTQAVLQTVGANAGSQVTAYWRRLVQLFESAFGSGISEGIIKGYTEIVKAYRPGDRIYLIGFSRGAYTARAIAGVIGRCGLLRSEDVRYAQAIVQLYRTRSDPSANENVRKNVVHPNPAIEFLGVFDTVASLGVPLWGWWFRTLPIWHNGPLATDPAPSCRHVYHALSMDERRSTFFPTLFCRPATKAAGTQPRNELVTLEQVWFRGAHADIGGGYARRDLSDITLGWMMNAMVRHGLSFRDGVHLECRPNALGREHDELEREPGWVLFGSWPRWHPVPTDIPDPFGTTLHSSVGERSAAVQKITGRVDFVALKVGQEPIKIVVEAQKTWNRTGVVIEQGATYLLTYVAGTWRDADADPCGPAGQNARGLFDIRRYAGYVRRLSDKNWMTLIATVAHPRKWDLLERGFKDLVRILFFHEPRELTDQLAAIGETMTTLGSSILMSSEAPSGLLYLFANDWWQTASNNSGSIQIEIRRVDDKSLPNVPHWILNRHGRWQEPNGAM